MRLLGRHQSVTTASGTYTSSAMLDLVIFLRASFLLAAIAVRSKQNSEDVFMCADSSQALLAHCVPSLRTRFLAYGSRQNCQQPKKLTANPLDALATFQVPHSWFGSFYLVSTLCSFIWFSQILLDQSLWRHLAFLVDIKKSMTLDQIIVTWILMLLQGVRRLYECCCSDLFPSPSNSSREIL
jgi:3-oxo-5-alpha-steroid 4-dehydrogenase 3